MACPEFEDLILDYCDGAASPADSAILEAHIAVCAGCRWYLAAQQELDLRLAKSLPRPALSPQFTAHLAARIAIAGGRNQRRHSQFRSLPRILDGIGYLSMAAAAVCLMQQLPHAGVWIALTASAAFTLWQTGKALWGAYGQ
jgi:anti-sigma factor RsiW